ncbi:hypothetical protein L873DRAFT_1793572 [Choiromyces venosus 120613-1]|uniref:Uncharacterized protein n=1 Tax=Choiromyces venosus 120613-1 TaxID=1336337 RepID=A0A3N4J5D2_9PEZI|nr:hypothetical protein L873DRAFT_1793572 [Choiromyces venosus 120613-1]
MAGQVGHHYQEPSTSEWVESPTWQNYLPDQFQPSYELESLQYNDPNLFHPFIGDEGLYPYVDPGFLPIGGENQHLLWPIFERPAVPWTGNTPEASTAQELLPQKTKPVTTEEDHGGNSPGGSSYLTFSTPQLAGSGSSCSGSPAVPNTPCWTPLTKVDVAQGQFARYQSLPPLIPEEERGSRKVRNGDERDTRIMRGLVARKAKRGFWGRETAAR